MRRRHYNTGGVWYILTTKAASLYSVVLAAGGLEEERAYVRAFLGALAAQMKADGLAALYDEAIMPAAGDVVLVKTADRSVVQSMNNLAAKARRQGTRGDGPLEALSRHLNGTPIKSLGLQTPREAIERLHGHKETTG